VRAALGFGHPTILPYGGRGVCVEWRDGLSRFGLS